MPDGELRLWVPPPERVEKSSRPLLWVLLVAIAVWTTIGVLIAHFVRSFP